MANGRLDVDVPVTLAAETGRGLFGSPGIEGHRNGLDAFAVLTTVAVRQPDPQQLVIEAEDRQAGLRLTTELRLHADSGVLQLRHCLTNLHPGDWQVQRLAVTLPLPESAAEVMAFHGRWVREFQPHRTLLSHGSLVQENRRGRTSHEYFPAMISGEPGFAEQHGRVWGAHLGWSATIGCARR